MNQMFKKYLIKNNFWLTKKNDCEWFVKHTPVSGGIYAKLMQKGVEIQHSGERVIFTNFNELDDFLDKIKRGDTNEFVSILNRRDTTKMLRKLDF
jgi:hypothetical protein